LILLAAAGGGLYWLWQTGKLSALGQSLSSMLGGGGEGQITQDMVDQYMEEQQRVYDEAVNQAQSAQLQQLLGAAGAGLLGLFGTNQQQATDQVAHDVTRAVDAAKTAEQAGAVEAAAAAAAPAASGMTAGKALWTAIGVGLPVWLGTSKAAGEMVHEANIALTHAIGQETAFERGNITLMTRRGPVINNRNTQTCYNLAGKEIPCPDPADVIGIEGHSLAYLTTLVEEGSL